MECGSNLLISLNDLKVKYVPRFKGKGKTNRSGWTTELAGH